MVLFPDGILFLLENSVSGEKDAALSFLWNEVFILGDDFVKGFQAVYDPWKLPSNRLSICTMFLY